MAKTLSYDDLLTMTHGDLLTLQANVAKALAETEAKNRKAAVEELKARARELGFDASDLFGKSSSAGTSKSKQTSIAKYANPENELETWSGRGRKPAWVISYLETGKPLDDLLIKSA